MSRSRRKPYITDQQHSNGTSWKKRKANKAVRKSEVSDGKNYRKVSDSWDIRDWSFYVPEDPKAKRK